MVQRTWFITGISSGFGRHLTGQLLGRGDRVAGTVRKPGAVDDLAAVHGDRIWPAELDVTDLPEVRRVVDRAFAELGRVDVVVNNAGHGLFGAAEEVTDEQVMHELSTNLLGSIQVVRAALPHLRATDPGASLYHLRLATPMAAYDDSPAAMVRGVDSTRPPIGDPARMAALIIASADQEPAPLRLVLGSDSYRFITAALAERLAQIEPQQAQAESTDEAG